MAVTIDEMQVEVDDATSPEPSRASAAPPRQRVDLHAALAMLRERESRLRAD